MSNHADDDKDADGIPLNRQKLSLEPGSFVLVDGKVYKLVEILGFDIATGMDLETGRVHPLKPSQMKPLPLPDTVLQKVSSQDMLEITGNDWKRAYERYEAIKPLLESNYGRKEVEARAKEVGVNAASLYRWLKRYKSLDVVAVLIPKKPGFVAGNSRLEKSLEDIIDIAIKNIYLTNQRSTKVKVIQEVKDLCDLKSIKPPGDTAIKLRIDKLSEKTVLRAHGYKEKAKNKFTPVIGSFPNADYPLAVVQIDHTPVDIILVDDKHRKPIGRPYLTLAVDVYSRMVAGYYLSFDPPSETSVAMCVAHAILPKEDWLILHKVDAVWEVFGFMDTIHTDNGADFRSDTLKKACLMYGINLEFRPVRLPKYGGHVERILGTILREVHNLPGTTFSNIAKKEGYDSEKNAVMTFSEFEKWLVTFICMTYHERLHTGIGMTPKKMWEIGIFGNASVTKRGLPKRASDPHTLMLDFLPYEERTIQTYGVGIDRLKYYSDVLRHWINALDPENKSEKRMFIFRIDPRDISHIWFYDPDLKQYFKIPNKDMSFPPMSAYELRQVKDKLRKEGIKSVNTHQLIKAYRELRQIQEESTEKTKSERMKAQRRKIHEKKITPVNPIQASSIQENKVNKPALLSSSSNNWEDDDIQPFDDLA